MGGGDEDMNTLKPLASLVAQRLKRLPPMRETGSIPGSGRSPWRRKWQPAPVFLPGESHEQRSLVATVHGVSKSRTRLSDFTFTFKTTELGHPWQSSG